MRSSMHPLRNDRPDVAEALLHLTVQLALVGSCMPVRMAAATAAATLWWGPSAAPRHAASHSSIT